MTCHPRTKNKPRKLRRWIVVMDCRSNKLSGASTDWLEGPHCGVAASSSSPTPSPSFDLVQVIQVNTYIEAGPHGV